MTEMTAIPATIKLRRSTNTKLPEKPVLRAPLVVRYAQREESPALASLLGSAYPTETWEPEATEKELFDDVTVKAPLVVADQGRILSTASLQVRPDAPECGLLRWVATDSNRRRQGFAQLLVLEVLTIAAELGCQELRLSTTTDLEGAIAMYTKLGFEPVLESR